MKILLAADDADSRALLQRTINAEPGHDLTEVYDGDEAMVMLADPTRRFDAAILDLAAPQLDGLAVAERIRSLPAYRQLPIVLCTSVKDRDAIRRAAQLSIRHYVVKPYGGEMVVTKLRALTGEVAEQASFDNSAEVAQRLGVSPTAVPQLNSALLAKVQEWLTAAHECQKPHEFAVLGARVGSLRAAAMNLSLRDLSRELELVETKFANDFAVQHGDLLPPAPLEVAAELKAVEVELERLRKRLRLSV